MLSCLTCNEVINISDNIHADGAGQVIPWDAESPHHEAREQKKFCIHADETDMTEYDAQLTMSYLLIFLAKIRIEL